jgi:glycosyltransferase involved in cell wall biosynthesis
LNSCVEQTLLPLEIIVVDDASRDGTVNLVENWMVQYKGKVKIVVKVLEINSGPSVARNVGWDVSRGDYVAFLDADDRFVSNKLEVVETVLGENNDIVLFAHGYALREKMIERVPLKKVSRNMLLIKNIFATPAVVVKRTITERFDESMRYTEDHDLWLRLTRTYDKTYYVDDVLTVIDRPVRAEGGQSANLWAMRSGEIKMYYKFCKSNSLMVLFPMFLGYSLAKHTVKYLKGSA